MKVAITCENGEVFQHFGRTPQFKVYEIEDGKVVGSEVIDTNGTGHGALAGFLQNLNAEVLICGGIGGGAVAALSSMGVKLYAGASGNTDDVINTFIAGTLPVVGDATCDCHGHDHEGHDHEGHDCSHGEGHDCSHGGGCHH